ncbi:MAG TPA: hypothetical protein VMH24_05570 [Candidatus Sulfotelmatobacter sp.]|nr:hypothetical protein [Candidatus Sulfotelmatobacter sp.]
MTEPNEPIVWQPEPAVAPQPAGAPEPNTLTSVVPVTVEAPAFQGRIGRGNVLKAAIGLLAGVAIVASVAVVAGTTPSGNGDTAGAAPQASAAPKASGQPGRFPFGPSIGNIFGFGVGPGRGGVSAVGFGSVTIASISGDSIGLRTADGWTRTITLGSSVKITEAGRTMAAGDLAVGQAVRLLEKRNTDGTFTVNGLDIVTPSVVGQVTAKTATTITIKRFDGTTQVIDVDSSTTYKIAGASTSNLAAVTIGMTIVASGPQASGGPLHAFTVQGGTFKVPVRPNPQPHASGAPPNPAASGTNG